MLRAGHWQLPDGLCFWLPPTLQELSLAFEREDDERDNRVVVVFGDWSSSWKTLFVECCEEGSINIRLPTSDVRLDPLSLCRGPTFTGSSQANIFVKDLWAVDLCQPLLEHVKGVVILWVQFTSVSFAEIWVIMNICVWQTLIAFQLPGLTFLQQPVTRS